MKNLVFALIELRIVMVPMQLAPTLITSNFDSPTLLMGAMEKKKNLKLNQEKRIQSYIKLIIVI